MPSPFGEGQTDTPINHHHLGEVITTIKKTPTFLRPVFSRYTYFVSQLHRHCLKSDLHCVRRLSCKIQLLKTNDFADSMLSKVADFYEAEVDDAVDALSSLMEPMIMVVLGTLIGGMVIAMYLPIFKMGQVV
jgi:hypothetical protein